MERPVSCRREITSSQFGNNTTIHQGDNIYQYYLHHQPVRAATRVIPYPLNEELVQRPDLMDKLNTLLPPTLEYCSAALWGLGGSGYVLAV